MKTLKIETYLRPAVPSDVFSNSGNGAIIENKQFFYKEKDGSYLGPYRMSSPSDANFVVEYVNIFQLLEAQRIYVVDLLLYSETIKVQLKIKLAVADDILSNAILTQNTAYFIVRNNCAEGPYYINDKTTNKDLHNFIKYQQFYVFAPTAKITEETIFPNSEAV